MKAVTWMSNVMAYKSFTAKIEYSTEDEVLFGEVDGVSDLISFEGKSVPEIEQAFHNAVDEYLDLCKQVGKDPDKVYRGSFNVRISPTLHRALAVKANHDGKSLNQTIATAVSQYLGSRGGT
jgi:predicted HicB family RNase H-like nuclease